jgi:hypothetical protein
MTEQTTPERIGIFLQERFDGMTVDVTTVAARLRLHASALRSTAEHLSTMPTDPERIAPRNNTTTKLHAEDGTVIGTYHTDRDEPDWQGEYHRRRTKLYVVREDADADPPTAGSGETMVTRANTRHVMPANHDAAALLACADDDEAFALAVEDAANLSLGHETMERMNEIGRYVSARCGMDGGVHASLSAPRRGRRTTEASIKLPIAPGNEPSGARRVDVEGPTNPLYLVAQAGSAGIVLSEVLIYDSTMFLNPTTDAVEILRTIERHEGRRS